MRQLAEIFFLLAFVVFFIGDRQIGLSGLESQDPYVLVFSGVGLLALVSGEVTRVLAKYRRTLSYIEN